MQPVPAQRVQPQVTPAQPVPGQPVQQPNRALPGNALPANNAAVGQTTAESGQARLIRGRSLIGMNIWGANHQQLGTIKDFIVDYQGGCPSIFFAVAPDISGWSGDYVIVPFNAFQVGPDPQQRTDFFTLSMNVDELRRAPHLAVEKWNQVQFQDRQTFANAKQYYERVERTAARPETGGREERPALPSDAQRRDEGTQQQPQQAQPRQTQPQQQQPRTGQPSEKQPEQPKAAPGTQPNEGRGAESDRQPGAAQGSNQGRKNPDSSSRERPDDSRR